MITPRTIVSGDQVARHYDELTRFYLDVWGEHIHHGLWISGRERAETAVRQLVDLVAIAAEVDRGQEVCDIGAGYGAAARQIARHYGAKVTAVTLSPRQYEYAQQKGVSNDNPTYVLGDWLQNQLPTGGFDAACAIECASHMADLRTFANEAARVLKPGGRFVMCAWVASELADRNQVRFLLEPICREGRLAHLSTAREYVDVLEDAGLSVVHFRDLSSRVRRTWTVVLQRTLLRLAIRPSYMRYMLRSASGQRIFLATIFRLWFAYRSGALRYCMFKCRKTDLRSFVPVNLA